jgi:hypothetical protein
MMLHLRRYVTQQTYATAAQLQLAHAWSPIDRYTLLGEWAAAAEQMARLHPSAFPTRRNTGEAQVLADVAVLLRLAEAAELTVAESDWRPVGEMCIGDRFWQHGWAVVSDTSPVRYGRRLEYDRGRQMTVFAENELVRVAGPDRFTVVELACDAGALFEETREWYWLANTASHDHRAALFTTLTDIAARRVGAAAAGVLADLADTEIRVAAELPGGDR